MEEIELQRGFEFDPWVIPTGVGVLSFALGGVAGYLLRGFRLKDRLDEVMTKVEESETAIHFEIEQQNRRFNRSLREIEIATDQFKEGTQRFLDRPREEIARSLHPTSSTRVRDNGQPPIAFQEDADWDYEAEKELRTKDRPYIIHYEEYFDDGTVEPDYETFSKSTLTYYAMDDVLADDHDTPVYNYQTIVGELKFGHGSRDPSVVYVRNEHLHSDFEISLNVGSFTVEVLGEEIQKNLGGDEDLRHSAVRKFKKD